MEEVYVDKEAEVDFDDKEVDVDKEVYVDKEAKVDFDDKEADEEGEDAMDEGKNLGVERSRIDSP